MANSTCTTLKRRFWLLVFFWSTAGVLPFFAQTNSISETYMVLGINNSNVVFDMMANTGFADLQGSNLGSFSIGTNQLVVRGALQRTTRCGGGTITASRLKWRVWLTSDGPSGAFNTVGLTNVTAEPGGCGNNQLWQETNGSYDLAANLMPGNYTFEAYTEADGTPTNPVANNGGANYKATFTIGVDPSKPVLVTSSATNPKIFATNNLGNAFFLVNSRVVTQTITIYIAGNTTENVVARLLGSVPSGGNYSSVRIEPYGGGARTILGNLAGEFISLDGADFVTFDGLNTGGNSLTLRNNSTSSLLGTSTLKFVNDARSNTVTNCTIIGSSTTGVTTPGGTIWFASGTSSGNSFNTISNCSIGPVGNNLPTKAIYGGGNSFSNLYNTFSNNKIYNFFSATADSAGFYISGGCDLWTIDGNRFYQTASRTFLGNALNCPINVTGITSGIGQFTITNNIIGYSAATSSGLYTLVGGQGRFIGIFYNAGIGASVPAVISSNTITKVSLTGVGSSGTGDTTPFAGIVASTGKVVVNSNIIGSLAATGTLTFSTNTTSDTEVYGICMMTYEDYTSNGNQVGGISISNLAAGSPRFGLRGMCAFKIGGSPIWSASSNTIGGSPINSMQNNSVSDSSFTHGMSALLPSATLNDNTVRNLTSAGGTQLGSFTSVAGIYCENGINQSVSRNTVYALNNTHSTNLGYVCGIEIGGNSGNVVDRNFIYRLTASSASANVTGIFVLQGSNTVRNNMIALGATVTNSVVLVGINDFAGSNNLYHNTIYIGGNATTGSAQSACVASLSGAGTHDIRNNILANVRTTTGSSGLASCVMIPGNAPNPPGYTLDYNIYYIAVGNFLGVRGSSATAILDYWQTWTGQEAHGDVSNPQFSSVTAAIPDLHIKSTPATKVESRGVSLAGITDDFDGEARSGLTPVDIGADAGVFTAVDTTAPVITYTPFPYGTTGSSRTVSGISITDDVTGVATASGSRPRLYYKKSTDPNTVSGWKYVEASGVNPYDFSINYTYLNSGGVSGGDIIQYFIVAQDQQSVPNVSINGGTWAVAPASVNLGSAQFPIGGTLPSYVIKDYISGNKTVCPSGCDFSSLTNENGAFAKINASEMAGSVQLLITGNLTAETGTYALDQFIGGTAGTYRVVIRPSGAARTISGSYAGGLIRLNGADRVTIDGSLSNTANTVCPLSRASRDLTIENTSVSTFASIIRLQNTASFGGASNNIVKNCRIKGVGTTQYGIICGAPSSIFGIDHDNNSFINNEISGVDIGIVSHGEGLANKNTGTVITLNQMDAVAPYNLGTAGIVLLFDDGAVISGNTIAHVKRPSASTKAIGISLGMPTSASNYLATGYKEVTGATVSNNTIYDIEHMTNWDAYGIVIGAISESGTTPNKIWNNSISGIRSKATPTSATFGIYVGANLGATQIYYNAISLSGTTSDSTNSYGIFVDSANPTVDIRNNVVANKGTALSTGKGFGISFTASSFDNVTSNNNDVFVTNDSNHFAFGKGSAQSPTGSSLSAWTAATGKDAASVSVDPSFASDNDLRLLAVGANTALVNAGADLSATVSSDIDCAARDTTPTLGCKQLSSIPACSGSNGGTAVAANSSLCNGSGSTTITASGFSTGSNTLYQWQYATTASFTSPVNVGSASTSYADLATGMITATRYYRLAVTCPSTSQTGFSSVATVLVNAPVVVSVAPSTPTICLGGSVVLSASGATTYAWSPSTGLSSSTGATVTANPTVTTTYTVTGDTNGCTATSTVTITVVPVVSSPVVSSNSPICSGSNLNLSSNPVYLQGYDMTAMSGQAFTMLSASNATVVSLSSGVGNITIPSFRYNNVVYTQARVSEKGVLVFGTDNGTVNSSNTALPATVISGTGNSQAAICAHWDNNTTTTYSKILTKTSGDEFIIQWSSYNDVSAFFEIRLNTVTGVIHLVYKGAISWGQNATIGLNYGTGSALQYSYNTTTSLNGQSITFTPKQAAYSWSGPNGFNSSVLNPVLAAATTLAGGSYVLTATDPATGCSASSSLSVVVKPTPAITISPSGPYCGSGATTLTASGATSYTWSPATGLDTTTGPTVIANPSVATVYTVTGVTDGCPSSRSVTVFPGLVTTAASNSPRCSGDTVTLTTPTVTTTNYIMDGYSNVPFIDISASGADVPDGLGGDSNHSIIIPSFVYNGVSYTTARVGNDGVVVLGAGSGSIVYNNSALPQGIGAAASSSSGIITGAGNSLAAICAYWDDLDIVSGTTTLKTQTVGDKFIIQWTNEKRYGVNNNGTITFQVQLELSTGKIHIVYRDVTFNDGSGKGAAATIGLNFSSGSALQYSFNTASLSDGQSISFLPNTITYSWTGPNGFTSNQQNPVIAGATVADAGNYTVTVTNSASGCSGSATTPVVVLLTPEGGTVTGGGGMCFGAHACMLSLSGYTGDVIRWEKSETPYTDWTEVASTSSTLDPGVLYNETKFRAVVQAGCGIALSNEVGFTFAFTTWNGTWTNGLPEAGKSVTFSADFIATSDIDACEVFIDQGATVLFPATEPDGETSGTGFDLNANGAVFVASGKLIFEQGSNLVQKDYTGTNSGDIRMKTNVKLWRQDYVYWGSPVEQSPFSFEFDAEGQPIPITVGNTLRSFSPATLSQRFYTFDPATNAFVAQFGANDTMGAQNPAFYTFELGKGYMVRAPNTFPNPPASPVGASPVTQFSSLFVGVPHNGTITVPTPNGVSNAHLLANPYPSPIKALGPDGFLATNPGTLYFWTHHDQLPASSNYAMCNIFGSTAAYRGGEGPNGTIQVGQGFIFQNETGLPEVTFTNAMRIGNNEGQFFRKVNDASRIWLNIDNGLIKGNQMMVGYTGSATAGIDISLDGILIPNGTCISSLIGNTRYGIQARPAFNTSDIVPMGLKVVSSGTHTISLDHADGIFQEGQDIFLKDNLMGIITNLKLSPYTFTSTAGDFDNRFQLQFVNALPQSRINAVLDVVAYVDDNHIMNLDAGASIIDSVRIFDIRGRMVYSRSKISSVKTRLDDLRAEHQMLLVQVMMENGEVITKKVAY